MTVKNLVLAVAFIATGFNLAAQDGTYRSYTPADQWELGLNLGSPYILGDIDQNFGFGGGLHLRKAFDHVFSLRFGAQYLATSNEDDAVTGVPTASSETTVVGGYAHLVMTVNNLRFNKPYRKWNVNVFTGLGVNSFMTDYTNVTQRSGSDREFASGTYENDVAANLDFGAGLAYRIGPKINIGLEYTVTTILGPGGDMLDADENVSSSVTTFRDFLHYPHLSINFNLGGSKNGVKRSEPLYWANPMTATAEAIAALEARPVYDPTDTDGDGIIDMIDQEKESPAGARVDTKGVAADSDGDKVMDYKDKEPYSPPGYSVDAMGVAQVPKAITEADVNRIVDAKLAAFKVPEPKGISNWFLPMVNFDNNSYAVKYGEYENIYQIAQVLKQNSSVKLVVTGHTDNTGSEGYNKVLSYNRANAAIEFLTSQHGISRDRLILNYAGEATSLVPVKGSNRSNRRVEFKVAAGETEQARPEGPKAGTGGSFKGNKDAGY